MDTSGAETAQLARTLGGALEHADLAESCDAADETCRRDARGLADRHDRRHRIQELRAVRRRLHAELETVVLDADAHRRDAVACRRDLARREQSARRLH